MDGHDHAVIINVVIGAVCIWYMLRDIFFLRSSVAVNHKKYTTLVDWRVSDLAVETIVNTEIKCLEQGFELYF